jgi:hypothetical protein
MEAILKLPIWSDEEEKTEWKLVGEGSHKRFFRSVRYARKKGKEHASKMACE